MRISDWSSDVCSSDLFDLLRLDVHLRAGDQIYVTGMGLESEWQADIPLGGTPLAPRVTGEIDLVRGTLDFAGRSFDLAEGKLTFPTGDAYDPSTQLLATDQLGSASCRESV